MRKKLKDPKKSAYMKKFYQEHKEYFTNYNKAYYYQDNPITSDYKYDKLKI